MQEKHDWGKVVQDPKNWNDVKSVINDVIQKGNYEPYKSVSSKILNVNGYKVRVTYLEDSSGIRISDAWIE